MTGSVSLQTVQCGRVGTAARAVAHVPRPLYRHSTTSAQRCHHLQPVGVTESSVTVIIPTNGSHRRVGGRNVCLVHRAVKSIIDRLHRGTGSGRRAVPELVVVTTPGIEDTVPLFR